MQSSKIGIDAGGTLIKVAYTENESAGYRSFRSRDMDEAAAWIENDFDHPSICITGGKVRYWRVSFTPRP